MIFEITALGLLWSAKVAGYKLIKELRRQDAVSKGLEIENDSKGKRIKRTKHTLINYEKKLIME